MQEDTSTREFTLVRFLREPSHVECFRAGHIRLMNAKYYKELEKHSTKLYDNRYDSLENCKFIYNSDSDGNITFQEPLQIGDHKYNRMWINPAGHSSPVRINNDVSDEITKISCLYSIYKDEINGTLSSCISNHVYDFGNYYCLITNKSEFFSRLVKGLINYTEQRVIQNPHVDFVKYVDENSVNGRYGAFCKPSGLCWQNEFRIKLETRELDPFWLNIDPLTDITKWGKISDLLDGTVDNTGRLIIANVYD